MVPRKVNRTLTGEQRKVFARLRDLEGYTSAQAYIYSTPVRDEVKILGTDHFFLSGSQN